jgi:glyoxalase family protein
MSDPSRTASMIACALACGPIGVKLDGIHHISAITGDAPGNVEFYTGVLGMRMVKRTVNQDEPAVYHLFYGDEAGSPGMDLTFFEYPGAAPGVAGSGMVHRIVWRVASQQSVEFWKEHLARHGVAVRSSAEALLFSDPEGLEHELVVDATQDARLSAASPEIPAEHALLGFDGVRAYSAEPPRSERLLGETLGFDRRDGGEAWEVRGEHRGSSYAYDPAPPEINRRQGAGSVHHVAFAAKLEEIEQWRTRIAAAGARPTPVIERFYFKSVYFLEPSGVLFEIATIGPGFAIDEDPEHLGERLSLPAPFEPMREQLEATLKPLPYPPAWRAAPTAG